jgi:hypothetical protein
MTTFLRFLRPMAYLRRRAIMSGLLGGNRTWLLWGGLAWALHWLGRILGGGDATPRYTQELGAGERIVVVHESKSPRELKKAAKAQRKAKKAS